MEKDKIFSRLFDGAKYAFSKTNEQSVLNDGELIEEGFEPEVKNTAVGSMTEEPKSQIQKSAIKETKTENLYGNKNRYTGSLAYDDSKTVDFSVGKSSEIRRTAAASETVKPVAASETFEVKDMSVSIASEPVIAEKQRNTYLKNNTVTNFEPSFSIDDDTEVTKSRAPMGFNTNSAIKTPTLNFAAESGGNGGGVSIKTNSINGGRKMDNVTVQVLNPVDINEAEEAGNLLKKNIIVVAVLSGIADKNARVRYSDFLTGCCKGCDAEFKAIVPVELTDSVLVAVPKGVKLSMPSEKKPVAESNERTFSGTSFEDIFG